MTDPKRVFCHDCRNYLGTCLTRGGGLGHTIADDRCRVAVVTFDPIHGQQNELSDARELNANFDCPHWTPHGADRIAPGPVSNRVEPDFWDRVTAWFRGER